MAGTLGGCLGAPLDRPGDSPRLVGLVAGNWHPDPHTLNVLIESDHSTLYDTQVQFPGGDPSDYDRPSETLAGYPTRLPPSATLVTWVEGTPRGDAETIDFGRRSTDCIGIEIDICPECGRQKGQEEITVPDTPDILVKHTASCQFG